MAVQNKPKKHGQTGPVTPEGKARSSKNAVKHGCRTSQLIMGDEKKSDYNKLVKAWDAHFAPQSELEQMQIEKLAQAEWFLMRTYRQEDEAKRETQKLQKRLRLLARYRTAAKNHFNRVLRETETTVENAAVSTLQCWPEASEDGGFSISDELDLYMDASLLGVEVKAEELDLTEELI